MTTTKNTVTKARTARTGSRGATAPPSEKKATAAKRRPTTAKTAGQARGPSLLAAAIDVLKRRDEPMGAKDIVTQIIDEGLWSTQGKTPEATLYSAMLRDITTKGDQARFQRVSRGRFALTDAAYDD